MTARHYQAICGIALIALFLLLMQLRVEIWFNVLMLIAGAVGIWHRIRFNPLFVFLPIGGGLLFAQYHSNQMFSPDLRAARGMDLGDILLCVAVLAYLVAHYRLHSLWFHILPDSRATPHQTRSEKSMTADELFWFVMPIPLFALAAQSCLWLLKLRWNFVGLPSQARQFLAVTWTLLLVMFVAANFFRYWRRLQMDPSTAQILLQDVLWNETRGEQRRINRWIVWRKLKKQEEKD